MTIEPLQEKISKLQKTIIKLNTTHRTIQIVQVLGVLVEYSEAIQYGPFLHHSLEMDKSMALKVLKGNFHFSTTLSETSIMDLTWFLEKAHMYPKPRVHNPKYKLTTDASDLRWGAVSVLYGKTGGKWSSNERDIHINSKEMLGVLNGLKHFYMNCTCATIHIESENTTTVAYINKLGGCNSISLNTIAKDIWSFAIDKNLWLVATHIPGKINIVADKLSINFG